MSAAFAVPKPGAKVNWVSLAFKLHKAMLEQTWAKGKLSGGVELAIMLTVWQVTWAKERAPKSPPPEDAQISTAQFAKACGCRGKNGADVIQRALTRLRGVGLISSRREGKSQVLYWKLTPENWAAAPKYEPALSLVTRLDRIVDEAINGGADDEDGDELPAGQQTIPGREHVALASEQAQAIAVAEGGQVEVVNRLPISVGVDIRQSAGRTRLILREEEPATTDLQVGGQKLSDGAAADELLVQLAQVRDEHLRVKVTRADALDLVRRMGGAVNLPEFYERFRQRARALEVSRKPMTLALLRLLADDTRGHVRDMRAARRRVS